MSKTDLGASPIFSLTRDAIEAHLTIVFTALALPRTVPKHTGLSLRYFLRAVAPLRSATMEINKVTTTLPPQMTPDQQAILNALKTKNSKHKSKSPNSGPMTRKP